MILCEGGLDKLKRFHLKIKEEENIDFVIVNAENSSGGMGLTTKCLIYYKIKSRCNNNGKPHMEQRRIF